MKRIEMSRYEDTAAEFAWEVPTHFNFGVDVVDAWARRRPDHPALIWCDEAGRERRFTYGEISLLSNRMANALAARGIARGDRVIVMLPRVPEWQIAMLGCIKLGAIPIPCVDMLTRRDIAYRLDNSGARGAVTTASCADKFSDADALACRLTIGAAHGWDDLDVALDDASPAFSPPPVAAEDPAIMYYTSGSTGHPKGVLHAARALFAWRVSAWFWLDLDADDVMWCTADTGWSKAGTSILFGPWSCGATVLFHDGRFDPRRRVELIARHAVTVFCSSATELRRLVQEELSAADFARLRLTVSAGETVNPEIVRRWKALTGVDLLDGYGQTETLMTVLNYPAMPVKPGSMGRALPGTEVAVATADGAIAAPGETGRLVVRLPNPQVMIGYWREPEMTATSRISIDGVEWFVTGDLARMDEDGYVFYEGRDDDVISSAGYRIGPMEVESTLMEHVAVAECAVVGSPDAERGEVVKAFVVLAGGRAGSAELVRDLQEHVKRLTGPYKYPRRIEFLDELPKTVSGKIRRNVLRQRERAAASA